MDYRYESDDFHKSLEPMVIINDDISQEVSYLCRKYYFYVVFFFQIY